MDPLKVQTQIRQNAEEVSNFLNDLSKWESKVKVKDNALTVNKRNGQNDSSTTTNNTIKKEVNINQEIISNSVSSLSPYQQSSQQNTSEAINLSPATIAGSYVPISSSIHVPKALKQISSIDGEAAHRELGNEAYKNEDYTTAIKLYTVCLGMKANNLVGFSNRASAYLKLKEYSKAELDCNYALNITAVHVKSLVRRATARNQLGKHRGALADLLTALAIEPNAAHIRVEINKTKELLRSAVNRAPFIEVKCDWAEEEGGGEVPSGPVMPTTILTT